MARAPLRQSPSGAVRTASRLLAAIGLGLIWLAAAPLALAHGADALLPPVASDILFDWAFDPPIAIPLLLVGTAYLWCFRRVNAAHPANPVPRIRAVAFLAGLVAIEIALQSIIERYDTTLFSVHMVQHVLLTLVAAPLLALGAPVTLLLRVARPELRRRYILPVLHGRIARLLGFPVVSWSLLAAVMWGTHFSPIFDQSLREPLVHDFEHLAYLTAGLLFWWPAVGLDPSPWRMAHPVRVMYLFLQMPQNTFLAVAIYAAGAPLYPHYAKLRLPWGLPPLADQQLAGGIMWIGGDVIFITAIVLVVAGWMRSEERDMGRREREAAVALTEIRARETILSDRRARERADAKTAGRGQG